MTVTRENIGKVFTSNGRDTWKVVCFMQGFPGEEDDVKFESYQIKNESTGEVLTQIVFKEKEIGRSI